VSESARTFPLFGPLPTGQVAIEASAGTGKTFTLAALATRYLAEQRVTPSELLIVTFTRAATAELRSRIRGQMMASAAALVGESTVFGKDELSAHLAGTDRVERRLRLERAVSDFDAATISTMHSFAGQVRSTLGISAAIDPDARLSTDVAKLVRHACADALATAAASGVPVDDLPTLSQLVKAAERFVGDPDMVLEPTSTRPNATAAQLQLRDLVLASQANLVDRRQGAGTMGYDDVLKQLRSALVDESSASVIDALRKRFSVVLIDEFQDTDSVQWEIFSTLFGAAAPDSTLVLVGDPKQAIYRFRGADISVYLRAVGATSGTTSYTLGTNWRSDGAAVAAMHHVFDGATFGDEAIAYVPVHASDEHEGQRMRDADGNSLSGLAIRVATGDWLPRSRKLPITPKTARIVNRDLVAHIRGLLDGATIPDKDADGGARRLRPSDIAVLVTSGDHGRAAQNALRRQGVPAVVAGAGSVLSSWAADQVRLLLSAMERPSDLGRVRSYALSWFESWSPDRVAGADDVELAGLQERLADWTSRLGFQPVAEVLAAVWAESDVISRLLGQYDGDRNVTDLDHLAELLHDNAHQGMSGVAGLLALLDHPPESEADLEIDGDVVARRVESEAQAVQIMTVWKAKGLQFPVVCLPMLWRPGRHPEDVVYTDPETHRRTMDLAKGKDWPDKLEADERKRVARTEEASEQLRLLYVAMTRAQHHTAVWWANSTSSSTRALSRFLFARDPATGSLDPEVFASGSCSLPPDADVATTLDALAELSQGTVSVTSISNPVTPEAPWVTTTGPGAPRDLDVSRFTADLDRSVHRWSFSAITAGAEAGATDPYDDSGADSGADDERQVADGTSGAAESDQVVPGAGGGALGALRAGTEFGTFVHAVLERTDFAAEDLDATLAGAVDEELARSGASAELLAPEGTDGTGLLVAGLRAAVETPLGPLFSSTRLADIERRNRLDELTFDLRLGGGGRHPSVEDLGGLLLEHLTDDDPLRGWAASVAAGLIDVRLAGYLTGSIDLVARVPNDGGEAFVVADYKTNRLTPRGSEPGAADYDERHMADAMAEHHYPLQALLYGVALHRYLRSRRRDGARPATVLGAAYLFVRGMTGPPTTPSDGTPHGVFTWWFHEGLLDEASDLLDGRPPGSGR
jgi:exodeoxyribonuclease V beta subunit